MGAQPAILGNEVDDLEMFDAETSAVYLRWMETGAVPEGVSPQAWQAWFDGGCRADLRDKTGGPVTRAMLERWALTGSLR